MSRLIVLLATILALSFVSQAQAWPRRQRIVQRQVVVQKVQQVKVQQVVQKVYAQPIYAAPIVVAQPVIQSYSQSYCAPQAQIVAPVVGGGGSHCFFSR